MCCPLFQKKIFERIQQLSEGVMQCTTAEDNFKDFMLIKPIIERGYFSFSQCDLKKSQRMYLVYFLFEFNFVLCLSVCQLDFSLKLNKGKMGISQLLSAWSLMTLVPDPELYPSSQILSQISAGILFPPFKNLLHQTKGLQITFHMSH